MEEEEEVDLFYFPSSLCVAVISVICRSLFVSIKLASKLKTGRVCVCGIMGTRQSLLKAVLDET